MEESCRCKQCKLKKLDKAGSGKAGTKRIQLPPAVNVPSDKGFSASGGDQVAGDGHGAREDADVGVGGRKSKAKSAGESVSKKLSTNDEVSHSSLAFSARVCCPLLCQPSCSRREPKHHKPYALNPQP
jgi:hypothetical protein